MRLDVVKVFAAKIHREHAQSTEFLNEMKLLLLLSLFTADVDALKTLL